MSNHNDLGARGEQLAAHFLVRNGYRILARNWRCGRLEIDIIARDADTVVFAEVKTRTSYYAGPPEAFVTREKQRNIVKAAQGYLSLTRITAEARFDIISVVPASSGHQITHIKDAFYAILR